MYDTHIDEHSIIGKCTRAHVCICVRTHAHVRVNGEGGAGSLGGRGRVEGQSSEVGAELGGLRGGRGGDGGSEMRRGNSTVVPYKLYKLELIIIRISNEWRASCKPLSGFFSHHADHSIEPPSTRRARFAFTGLDAIASGLALIGDAGLEASLREAAL